jgi:hypothetical protein
MSINNSNILSRKKTTHLSSTIKSSDTLNSSLKIKPYNNTNTANEYTKTADQFINQTANTVLNGYFTFNFLKNLSVNNILNYTKTPIPLEISPNFQQATNNIQKSMNMFGLTTAISFLPNIIALCADGIALKLQSQNKAKKIIYDKQKVNLVNQLIEIRDQKDIEKAKKLQVAYQKIDTDNQLIEKALEKSHIISNHVKTISNLASSVGGLISANYLYKTIQDPHILPNMVNIINNGQSLQNHHNILQTTKLGMRLYTTSIGIAAMSGLWNLSDYCIDNFLRSKKQLNNSTEKKQSNTYKIIKQTILPSINQILNGLGTAILLQNPNSWNIGNIFMQGGTNVGINSLLKTIFLAGSIASVSGGSFAIINAFKNHLNTEKMHANSKQLSIN